MEYVEGQPIDRYCDERRLDIAVRIRLFVQVCEGVAFAHRNLVLHRDLKPSNILATADGHAKIVDFGTATLLQPERLVAISRAPVTPAYASPEQLTGGAVSMASDQYSLALVLYELLSGSMAFAARTSLISAVERALAGERPSALETAVTEAAAAARRTSVPRLRRRLSGDLDTIVQKALSPDPAGRYASVQHLCEDLDRLLRGEPILARPPSFVYHTSRFVRRHWLPVSLVAALLVSLSAATAISVRQASIARAESAKARTLNRFLTMMLSSANPTWVNPRAADAGSVTVREILDGASELVDRELGSTPEVEAEMRETPAATYLGMGATDKVLQQAERALSLYQQQEDDRGVAAAKGYIGVAHAFQGDLQTAEALLREAYAYVRARGEHPDPTLHGMIASDLGTVIGTQHPGHEEALALMRESIDVQERHGINPGGVAVTMHNLAIHLIRLGRFDEGEATLRESLRRMDQLPSPPPERASVLRTLGALLFLQGNYAEAERMTGEAVAEAARTRPPGHWQHANYKLWWGRSLLAAGQIDRAGPVLREAYDMYRAMRPAGHLELALPTVALGSLYRAEGRLRESERLIREGRAIFEQHPSSKDRLAEAIGELGLTLRALQAGTPRPTLC